MSLELIIQRVKAMGNLMRVPPLSDQPQQLNKDCRRFRVNIGNSTFISRNFGQFTSANFLEFDEPFSYIYDNCSHLLFLQIFKEHTYLDNSDLLEILSAEVDFSDLSNVNGDYIQTTLFNNKQEDVGKLVLQIEVFKKGFKCMEKVNSNVFFETVIIEKEKQIQASAASKNIKNLMVNNSLADTLMTINAMTLICEKEDPEIFNREAFVLVKYGFTIRAYSSLIKATSKESVNWFDYMEFMKNEGVKFQFFFFSYDELGNLYCKAKGQIKYVIFDQTINLHTITLFDKRSVKYATLMVKFIEKQVEKPNIMNKIDKKIKDQQEMINNAVEEFNRFKFENKNNNRILSEKLRQIELKLQQEEQVKQMPLNPEELKKRDQHSRFIGFLQKEMIKIQRELQKRQQNAKKDDRKNMYLPNLQNNMENNPQESPKMANMSKSYENSSFKGLKKQKP